MTTVNVHGAKADTLRLSSGCYNLHYLHSSHKCDNTDRTNVVTLPVQMWSHCPCKCGHTVRANVVTLPGQMWSHCPDKCDHTVRANVVTLSDQL